jgi:GT2 family glycosyltransferase
MRRSRGNSPSFSVVVPTFRRPVALRATLAALLALEYPEDRYEVIVVDDDAAEGHAAPIVRELSRRGVELSLKSQNRRGAASARNLGARAASGELLLFVDDDIVVAPDHLSRHLVVQERSRDALVNGTWEFAPSVLAALERTPFGRYRLKLERGFWAEVVGAEGSDGCQVMDRVGSWDLALHRDLFWQIGGFDERFPVAGAEDRELSLRARAAGCQLLLDTKILCLHNDDRVTLRAYCEREERSAKTMPYLARSYPREFAESPYVRENRPISRGEEPSLVAKKLAKSALARRQVMEALHKLTAVAEAAWAPDRILRRMYRLLLGLHLFRGFRSTWPG